jgi:hypothetical protein
MSSAIASPRPNPLEWSQTKKKHQCEHQANREALDGLPCHALGVTHGLRVAPRLRVFEPSDRLNGVMAGLEPPPGAPATWRSAETSPLDREPVGMKSSTRIGWAPLRQPPCAFGNLGAPRRLIAGRFVHLRHISRLRWAGLGWHGCFDVSLEVRSPKLLAC